ncbi:MAG: KH domain-containing protein [Vicinamibacterales bacterium]
MADYKGLIEAVARALADEPDAVNVRESERRGTTVYELQVAPGDLGRVIGRQGRTAAALRTLLSTAAEADDKRVSLDIRDQSGRN